jgi:UDP-N-acetylmuramate-alanine ligase
MASSIEFGYMALKHKFPNKNFFVIFQPHQINRIITGRKDFQKALKNYDQVIIYDIYAARENLSDLTKKIPSLKDITTLSQLGNTFSETCG